MTSKEPTLTPTERRLSKTYKRNDSISRDALQALLRHPGFAPSSLEESDFQKAWTERLETRKAPPSPTTSAQASAMPAASPSPASEVPAAAMAVPPKRSAADSTSSAASTSVASTQSAISRPSSEVLPVVSAVPPAAAPKHSAASPPILLPIHAPIFEESSHGLSDSEDHLKLRKSAPELTDGVIPLNAPPALLAHHTRLPRRNHSPSKRQRSGTFHSVDPSPPILVAAASAQLSVQQTATARSSSLLPREQRRKRADMAEVLEVLSPGRAPPANKMASPRSLELPMAEPGSGPAAVPNKEKEERDAKEKERLAKKARKKEKKEAKVEKRKRKEERRQKKAEAALAAEREAREREAKAKEEEAARAKAKAQAEKEARDREARAKEEQEALAAREKEKKRLKKARQESEQKKIAASVPPLASPAEPQQQRVSAAAVSPKPRLPKPGVRESSQKLSSPKSASANVAPPVPVKSPGRDGAAVRDSSQRLASPKAIPQSRVVAVSASSAILSSPASPEPPGSPVRKTETTRIRRTPSDLSARRRQRRRAQDAQHRPVDPHRRAQSSQSPPSSTSPVNASLSPPPARDPLAPRTRSGPIPSASDVNAVLSHGAAPTRAASSPTSGIYNAPPRTSSAAPAVSPKQPRKTSRLSIVSPFEGIRAELEAEGLAPRRAGSRPKSMFVVPLKTEPSPSKPKPKHAKEQSQQPPPQQQRGRSRAANASSPDRRSMHMLIDIAKLKITS